MTRRPLQLPISLAVVMLMLLVLIIVGFILTPLTSGATFWTLFVLGLVFLSLVVVGVVVYLTLSIKAINLTRRQSNFIDSVTHELKSPIASLKLYLQTLARRPVRPEEQAEFYKSMLEDVERLDTLISHILTAARLDRVDVMATAERIDLEDLLQKSVREVSLRHRKPVDIFSLRLCPCTVLGNRMDVALIFSNLLDNAVKYSDPQDPRCYVELEYQPARGVAIVRIGDNGPGIPRNQRSKVFGRFVRLGTELERKQPGTGLGLYIVRTLVQRWRGKVRLLSAKESGTVFEVTLPNATALGPSSLVASNGERQAPLDDSKGHASTGEQVSAPDSLPPDGEARNARPKLQEGSTEREVSS